MPIVEVELVLNDGEEPPARAAAALAEAAGAVFGSPAGETWVRLRVIPASHYAENGGSGDIRPVFVHVLRAVVPAGAELEREVSELTIAVARVCGRPPENVHVIYEPAGAGRVAFGGRIVEPDRGT